MSVVLVAAGATLFLLLGVAHAIFTARSTPAGGPMMPTDPDVRAAMVVGGGLGMAPEIRSNMFRAWIGFNFSHALGVVVTATIVLWLAIDDLGAALDQPWFLILIAAVPVVYALLAQFYWFDQPRNAIIAGTVLLWTGAILELL